MDQLGVFIGIVMQQRLQLARFKIPNLNWTFDWATPTEGGGRVGGASAERREQSIYIQIVAQPTGIT